MLHDPAGSGSTSPGVQVLQGGECGANSALSRTNYPLQSLTSVEGLKDPPGDSEFPQLPEVVRGAASPSSPECKCV